MPTSELARLWAGTCSTCSDGNTSGGGGGGGGRTSDPSPVGTAYWIETGRHHRFTDVEPAYLEAMVSNRGASILDHTVSLTEREVRRVEFSGGWATAFRASIGGEIDRSSTRSYLMRISPWHVGKVYSQQRTQRYTVFGTRYQDYSDGSRQVTGTDDGPYRQGLTHFSYVERPL